MFKPKINKTKEARILCFGSTRSRFYGLKKARSYPGPFEHAREGDLIKKLPHKAGYTPLASKTPRYKDIESDVPPVGTYTVEPYKPPKQCTRPFGMGAKLQQETKWLTPPPGAHSFFKRKEKVCTAFGRAPRITVPLVIIKCGQFNMSKCFKCEQQPVGDYWHKDLTNQDMCRPCMEKEWVELLKCSTPVLVRHRATKELQLYHLMRYCGFYHDHNCTKAAVQMMSTRDLIIKLRTENYLASFGF